jgi:hypothetical protein
MKAALIVILVIGICGLPIYAAEDATPLIKNALVRGPVVT